MLLISMALTILAYRGIEYKNGPIIESFGYIFVLVLSYLFFRERITWRKVAGNALIFVGIIVFYL